MSGWSGSLFQSAANATALRHDVLDILKFARIQSIVCSGERGVVALDQKAGEGAPPGVLGLLRMGAVSHEGGK